VEEWSGSGSAQSGEKYGAGRRRRPGHSLTIKAAPEIKEESRFWVCS